MIQDFHTYLFFCRVQERQREQEQRYLRAELRKVHRASVWQHILGRLSAFFMTPAASEQQRNMSIPLEAFVSEEEKLTQDALPLRRSLLCTGSGNGIKGGVASIWL